MAVRKPFIIIGVMGGHEADAGTLEEARLVGEAVAQRGYILLTGGGTGVMRAASEGAARAGGLVIGILPNDRRRPLCGYPNEFVNIPIYTGMADARNVINAKTPAVVVALGGGPGTLSEIALALNAGTPVIGLNAPAFTLAGEYPFFAARTVAEVLEQMDRILAGRSQK
ncbi:MAG: TIGR00725 family protein [Deltaproteobacteria bacterium]|nr:TIGR00725 family protein [Deltaproteobacteria bacterium]